MGPVSVFWFIELSNFREERGEKRGIQRGMQRGIQRGIERDRRALNKLNDLLLEDGRIEDLKRSTKDSDFQQKLLDEYGLTVWWRWKNGWRTQKSRGNFLDIPGRAVYNPIFDSISP